MKKFTILLIALLVASMGFAQEKQLDKQPTFRAGKSVATLTHSRAVTGTLQLSGELGDNAIGTGSAGTFAAAARFEASALTSYVGQYITKITIGIGNGDVITEGKVAILTGTADAPVIATQQVCTFTTGMNEIALVVPYQIPSETAIMVAYEVTVTGGYPIGCDAGPVVTGGNLINMEGLSGALNPLTDLASSLTYNFVIAATVEDEVSSDPVIAALPSELSFVAENNTNSEAQIVTINAANLTGNITASVAAPFEVSSDNTTFGTSATIASDGGSLYVRFSPTTMGNANGTITISSTGVENVTIALSGYAYDCGTAITAPWTETFEPTSTTVYCWSVIDENADENTFDLMDYSGNHVMYINYEESNDDYLVTPLLSIGDGNYITFKVAHRSSTYPETYEVYAIVNGVRTQIRDAAQTTTVMPEFELINIDLAAYAGQNIQIAIRNTSQDQFTFYVDDFSLLITPTAPEIALTSVAALPAASIALGQDVTISGVVTNNGIDLTSYTVSYTVDGGAAVEYNVTGINVAINGTHNFTHATPISGLTEGTHTVVVTVSNPNGVADGDANDNSQTITINVTDCSGAITTFPYEEDFENGIPACWTKIDNDGDGYNWITPAETNVAFATGYGHESDGAAVSWSYYPTTQSSSGWDGNSLNTEDYLITSAITLPTSGEYELSFFTASLNSTYADDLEVKISTTGTAISDFTTLIANQTISNTVQQYTEKTASLANYAGQTIYIAFVHVSNDKFGLFIDDVKIAAPTAANENIAETVAVYPNPTKDMVTVANAEGKNIVIVNSLGQVVANIENAAANQTIDVANFANGTYFVKVDAEVVKLNVVK